MFYITHSLSFLNCFSKGILTVACCAELLSLIPDLSVPTRQVVMAVTPGPFLALVLLLVSRGLQCSPPLPACPAPCLCQRAPLLNCSSSGLSLAPQLIQATITELDLSHNLLNSVTLHQPHLNLTKVWLGNNSITHLSLCVARTMGSHHVSGRHPYLWRPGSSQGCVSWAPALQLLSVERNQLVQLPEGKSVIHPQIKHCPSTHRHAEMQRCSKWLVNLTWWVLWLHWHKPARYIQWIRSCWYGWG